ncbi:hypothetical protein SISNIDRAFT_483922 [Sistotremastrum niveocremeum HHB9708]|uniref:DUF4139 domain-containing protein n=1 Tax=Sistotremastrum niveocremeum HHB9708 TaxID=1314777 RepID=A0A164X797_9AGAM|nr:hypothetical protein SISNIDRAFT_483922 [Sistotremastrum niveocremeum HHB9708]
MSNIVLFNASESAIDEVTVYQTNRAEIKRTIEINLKAGQNDVEVSGLPVYLLPESIHVDVLKNAAILDVIYKPTPMVPFSPYNEPPAAQGLLEKKEELESQKRILKSQERVLDSYAKSIDAKSVSPDRFVGFLDLFTDKKAIVEEQLSKLARDIKEVDKSIAEARAEASTKDLERSIKIVIVASAFADGPAKFILSYAVGGAQWTPLYDLRASVAQSAKVPPLLEVRYRAEIWQSTGEDWNGVKLVLSTASPQTGGDIPTLSAHHINEDRGTYYSSRHRSYSPSYPVMIQAPQAPAIMPGAPVVITSPRYARSRSPSVRSRRRSRSRSWSPDRAHRRARDSSPPPAFVPAMPPYPAPIPVQPPIYGYDYGTCSET